MFICADRWSSAGPVADKKDQIEDSLNVYRLFGAESREPGEWKMVSKLRHTDTRLLIDLFLELVEISSYSERGRRVSPVCIGIAVR